MSKSDEIKRNSNKIWLAGLGAYALMEEEGRERFERLVDKGQAFERENTSRGQQMAADSRLDELKNRANQTMDRIERAFDLRVSSALGRLGISRKSDLDLLHDKIDRLARTLEQIGQELEASTPPASPAAKPAARPRKPRATTPTDKPRKGR